MFLTVQLKSKHPLWVKELEKRIPSILVTFTAPLL